MSARGFWVSVSKALGGTRTPKQCRSKWCVIGSTRCNVISTQLRRFDTLQAKNGNEGKARWSKVDSYILICKYVLRVRASDCCPRHLVYRIASLNVDEETDIDWASLNDPSWMWSRHSLQRRWRGLKASLVSDSMSHRGESMTFCTFISLYISDRCRT